MGRGGRAFPIAGGFGEAPRPALKEGLPDVSVLLIRLLLKCVLEAMVSKVWTSTSTRGLLQMPHPERLNQKL